MIRKRALGATGVAAPVLGFGVSGPHATPLVPARDTVRLIRLAVELGIAVFDTAPFYGDGEAERRLGAALDQIPRDKVFVVTKAGTVDLGFRRRAKNFDPDFLLASLEDSCDRLGVDAVDAFLLHGAPRGAALDAALAALQTAKAGKSARLVGVCGRGAEMDPLIESGVLDLVMLPIRPERDADQAERVVRARAKGLGVLGVETMAASQPRWRLPRSRADLWYAARGWLQERAAAGRSPAEALTWALGEGGADVAVTTTSRAVHLRENVATAARAGA